MPPPPCTGVNGVTAKLFVRKACEIANVAVTVALTVKLKVAVAVALLASVTVTV